MIFFLFFFYVDVVVPFIYPGEIYTEIEDVVHNA